MLGVEHRNRLIHSQKLFEEAADLMLTVNEMNLENPMALLAFFIQRSHRKMAFGMNVESHFVAGNSFMRELSDQVPGNRPTEFPAGFFASDTA